MSHTTAGPAPTTHGGDTNKDRLPHPLTTHRRVVQVHRVIGEENAKWQGVLVTTVVCNDGSMWEMWNDGAWTRLPDVPQDEEKGQQERLAAVAPSPEASGEMQGSPPAPVAPAPIPLGATVTDSRGVPWRLAAFDRGFEWQNCHGMLATLGGHGFALTALYHMRQVLLQQMDYGIALQRVIEWLGRGGDAESAPDRTLCDHHYRIAEGVAARLHPVAKREMVERVAEALYGTPGWRNAWNAPMYRKSALDVLRVAGITVEEGA